MKNKNIWKYKSGSDYDDKLQAGLYFYFDDDYWIKIITLPEAIALKCKNQNDIYKILEKDPKRRDGYLCKCLTVSTIDSDY